jgi:hypothetical protein
VTGAFRNGTVNTRGLPRHDVRLRPRAIFCATGHYTGLIDFGEIGGAEPLFDLGHFHLHNQEAQRRPSLRRRNTNSSDASTRATAAPWSARTDRSPLRPRTSPVDGGRGPQRLPQHRPCRRRTGNAWTSPVRPARAPAPLGVTGSRSAPAAFRNAPVNTCGPSSTAHLRKATDR